ncbi:hypothetical protein HYW42_04975 [Candidatus Daviesbacteria bacterium]|nr:hypothetical protein [Candidatus Daviesbacteria bacterium]
MADSSGEEYLRDDRQIDSHKTTDDSGATVIINLEGLIKNHITGIANLKEEIKKHKEIIDDILSNDPTYKDHAEKAKEAARIKTATKNQILKQPHAADTAEKLKSMRSELKEQQDALSDYLGEYQKLSGVNEIEGDDGEVREIVYVAKLVKRSFLK